MVRARGLRLPRFLRLAAMGFALMLGIAVFWPGPSQAQDLRAIGVPAGAIEMAAPAPAPAETAAESGGAVPVEAGASFAASMLDLRTALREAMASARTLPSDLALAVRTSGEDGAVDWLLPALRIGAAALLAGWVTAVVFRWWARRRFLADFPAAPTERNQKIAYQLVSGIIAFVATLLFAVVAWAVSEYAQGEKVIAHRTVMIMIGAAVFAQLLLLFLYALLSPFHGAQRVPSFEDRTARNLALAQAAVIIPGSALLGLNAWFETVDLYDPTHDLFAIITTGIAIFFLSWICVAYRKAVANAILPPGRESTGLARWLARNWYVIAIVYFLFAWLVRAVRVLLDRSHSTGLVAAPILAFFVGLAIYGVALLLIERVMRRGVELRTRTGRRLPDHRDLVERAAAIAIFFIGLAVVFNQWGIGFAGSAAWGGRIFDFLVVAFAGWILYDMAKIAIDRKIASEDPSDALAGADIEGDVPMATAKTRLATLLPLVRVFVLTTIVVTIIMMALTQVGVNITPIFAGAGVVGLAIGFGSRQLVEDVISGAFYLADDAFRVGEYIDIGKVKGTVERISIRSFQLRHQNGPLNTIRFGEVSHVKNFSRDWAMMKLPIRVPLDTDSEKVRKIIKKVGEELQADPEYGPKFLQPLKSQGVYEMDDSALVIRVKFMTRPNDQFVLRRVVYHRIQDAFQKAGIRFANRVVTVRVEGDGAEPGSPEAAAHRKQAIAAAAREAIDADDKLKKS